MNSTEIQTKITKLKTMLSGPGDEAAAAELKELETLIDQETGKADLARLHAMGEGGARAKGVPDFDPRMEIIFERGFEATRNVWNGRTQTFDKEPDVPAQIKTLELYLKYRLGMPPQMVVKLDAAGFKDRQTELLELARTPSGRDALLKLGLIDQTWLEKNLPDSQK